MTAGFLGSGALLAVGLLPLPASAEGPAPVVGAGVDAGAWPPSSESFSESSSEDAAASAAPAGLRPPVLLWSPEPVYAPAGGEDASAPAEVRVRFLLELDPKGQIVGLAAQGEMPPELERRAEELVRRARFAPATRDGVPVPSRFVFELVLHRGEAPAPPEDAVLAPPEGPPPMAVPAGATPAAAPDAGVTSPERAADQVLPEQVVEVTVEGASREAALRQSAHAVTIVDTEQAKQEASDLGDVLARTTPVAVQRTSGLGSRGSYSLGGLGGERLRFFLDGVPLDLLGYSTGVANVPVNFIDRVEVYQGVVPVRFAGDALGGAVHLVTDQNVGNDDLAASYQVGSFGTHRAAVAARHVRRPSGLFVRGTAFYDVAENNYPVDVTAYDAQGRIRPVRLPLYHNGYRGRGTTVGVGVAERPWATRLVVQGFVSAFDHDVQNGVTMSRPYGEVTSARRSVGVNLKYVLSLGRSTRLEGIAGYTRERATFRDLSSCLYDWYGICTPRFPDSIRGEMSGMPLDRRLATGTFFLRATLARHLGDHHLVRVALAPTFADRSGENALQGPGYDPLAQPRRLFTGVAGVELESSGLAGRLENDAFVKGYALATRSQALLSTGQWRDMSRTVLRAGVGDSLRIRLARSVFAKASYEYALRQPSTDELFGDGALVSENLALRPETSHNANVGLHVEHARTPVGRLTASVNGFARWSKDLIAQLAENESLRNVNVWSARALGVEGGFGWTVPGKDWLSVDGRVTYQDLRNRSSAGELAGQAGDRIPNTPYFFSNAAVRLRGRTMVVTGDTVELAWSTRYVHAFLRSWESLARAADRLTIDAQLSHGLSLTYVLRGKRRALTAAFEVHNLTDEKLFDFYGLQRPGRAFFTKWTIE